MTEALLAGIVAVVLGTYLGLSILSHLPLPWVRSLNLRDRLAIIPHWTFFAPTPGTSDFHLLARDRLAGGGFSAWKEVATGGLPRTPLAFLWYPGKRPNKALLDLTTTLLKVARAADGRQEEVYLSIPYLMLLHTVSALPPSPLCAGRQFLLAKTDGRGAPPEVLFVSNVHEVQSHASARYDTYAAVS